MEEKNILAENGISYQEAGAVSRRRRKAAQNVTYILLSGWALIVLFPFYWMVLTSVKSYGAYNSEYIPRFYTLSPTLQNYVEAFTAVPLGRYMLNTLIFTLVTTLIMLVVITLAAFAFARLTFRGKNIVFEQIPDSLYYAAKVDGTSDLRYLLRVMIPISKPTLITITILKMIECWNSYVWPRLITDDADYFLVSNGIQEIRENGFGRENIPAMMAAVVVISVPLIVLFLVFRRKIMEGVSRGGMKG